LRTPTLSTGEKMLNAYFKNQTNNNVSIFEFEYPNCMKEVQDIMRDICWNAERKNLAIKTVRNLNGLLQCYSSITDINQEETIQVWYARIVNIFNLVEMPLSVSDLLVLGENRVFNFVESFNPLNMRKIWKIILKRNIKRKGVKRKKW